MLRFPQLEQFGITAAISGKEEGDCGARTRTPHDRKAFLDALGLGASPLHVPAQVHGHNVLLVGAESPCYEADGVVTMETGLTLGVTVADCVPLLFFAPDIPAVAAAHAGREGTFPEISRMMADLGRGGIFISIAQWTIKHLQILGADPSLIHAVIGPSAGPCCYEVSEEMAEAWRQAGLPVAGRNLDLWGANKAQLLASGLLPENIHTSGICTIDFHSLRGGSATARNLAVIHLHG